MAQWSTLPCCSCLFSTAHPHNEIASLQQFALIQHSGRGCRCSSCTGKHRENEPAPLLEKKTQQSFRWHWEINLNVFVKLHIKATGVDHPLQDKSAETSRVDCGLERWRPKGGRKYLVDESFTDSCQSSVVCCDVTSNLTASAQKIYSFHIRTCSHSLLVQTRQSVTLDPLL